MDTQKINLIVWGVMLVGAAMWTYGYFVAGTPPLIDWRAITPWWIADFLPNLEAEIGLVIVCLAMIPIYWPNRR